MQAVYRHPTDRRKLVPEQVPSIIILRGIAKAEVSAVELFN